MKRMKTGYEQDVDRVGQELERRWTGGRQEVGKRQTGVEQEVKSGCTGYGHEVDWRWIRDR